MVTSYKTAYNNGAYQIMVNKTLSDAWSNPGSFNFTDVRVEVDATKNGGSDNNDFGIICRYRGYHPFLFCCHQLGWLLRHPENE